MKRSEILRKAMPLLAVSWFDFINRGCSVDCICGAVWRVSGNFDATRWLFDNGRGRRTHFDGVYWIEPLTPESYTARIILLELGALMSEEEGQ